MQKFALKSLTPKIVDWRLQSKVGYLYYTTEGKVESEVDKVKNSTK